MDIKSLKETMQAQDEKIVANEQELVALKAACEDYKVDKLAVSAELDEAKADLEAKVAEHTELVTELKADLEQKDVALAASSESLEQMKADMAISPLANVIEGAAVVADGSVIGEEINHVAVMNAIEASDERIAYYRANKEIIDAAYKS